MDPAQTYLRICSQKGLLIDTNLLVLFLIGSHHPSLEQIRKCGRTASYDLDDFRRVVVLANKACKIIVTPQILAEVANLTFELRHQGGLDAYFKQVIQFVSRASESHTPKNDLINAPYLNILKKVGFADASVVKTANDSGALVLTDDGDLAGVLTALKLHCLNINHLRSATWLSTTKPG